MSPSSEPAGVSSLRQSVSAATERVHEIIDAAERVAEEIRAEAETEAKRYLEQRKQAADQLTEERALLIEELTESLLERAKGVQEQAEAMAGSMRSVIDRIRATAAAPPPATARGDGNAADGDGAEAAPTQASGEEPLLRATQMAVAGTGRPEIEETLKQEFGIEAPGEIVDQVLGSDK